MRRTSGLALGLMLLISPSVWASDPTGIYAVVDKVEFEPDEKNPERIKVWGTFALATKGREYAEAARGYMYFTLPKEKKDAALKEWMDLKKVAGSGDYVAFGARFSPIGKVRTVKTAAAKAEPAAVKKWLTELESDKPKTREEAEANLAKLGENAEKELKAALENKPSADLKARIEKLLAKLDGPPDPYPLGNGMFRDKLTSVYFPGSLGGCVTPLAPTDGEVPTGKITLSAKSLKFKEPKNIKFVFEIQTGTTVEKSEPIALADKETSWTPKMEIKAGESYTWRVYALSQTATSEDWKGPVTTVEFTGKAK